MIAFIFQVGSTEKHQCGILLKKQQIKVGVKDLFRALTGAILWRIIEIKQYGEPVPMERFLKEETI